MIVPLRAIALNVIVLILCGCACVSSTREATLLVTIPPAPFSMFTRYPYYAYNQTSVSGHGEYNMIPVDIIVVLSNPTSSPIVAPDSETLWPNVVDIEIQTRDGSIYKLSSAGLVSIRPTEKLKHLVVPEKSSIAYPVILDDRLFQNLPWLAMGDEFLVRAKVSWARLGSKRSSIAASEWMPVVYKAKMNADRFAVKDYGKTSLLQRVSTLFMEDDDIEMNTDGEADDKRIDFDRMDDVRIQNQ